LLQAFFAAQNDAGIGGGASHNRKCEPREGRPEPEFPRWTGFRLTLRRCLSRKCKGLRSKKRRILLSPAAPAAIGLYRLA
jgi:hypothetical protein